MPLPIILFAAFIALAPTQLLACDYMQQLQIDAINETNQRLKQIDYDIYLNGLFANQNAFRWSFEQDTDPARGRIPWP